ncbi:MAG: AbgT family transporter [Gammaproteobacteria bacterium]|nr:MAG: AbgT family transporter [Gammaproteobacteria bacterium]
MTQGGNGATTDTAAPGRLGRILNAIEVAGNRLPHPALLFAWMALGVLVISAICALFGVGAVHPVTQERIDTVNLLSGEGLRRILAGTVTNFTGFAPLGTVLVAMLGIGIAERSGLLGVLLRRLVLAAPVSLLTFFVVLAGVLSSLAADSGYVVLIPLAALVFIAAGRHPIAGIAAAFAGVSAGFSANLLIGPLDALLAGLSTEAVRFVDADYEVTAAGNWWFIIASTFMIAIVVTLVTEFITERRLAPADLPEDAPNPQDHDGDPIAERRGLIGAGVVTLVLLALILLGVVPADGVLRDPETGSIMRSPFISGIVVVIALWAALCGVAYGRLAGTFADGGDVIRSMERTMETMAVYLVLMFFASQFVAWFGWTNLGLITAIGGSQFLATIDPGTLPLLLIFVILAAFINLLIGSATAKWAIMGPVFVPMLYLLGISPEATQMAYRIGDSVTNIITPLMPYFALVLAFAQQYDKRAGLGTLIATMIPYSIALLLAWSGLLTVWVMFDIPLGPGASINL